MGRVFNWVTNITPSEPELVSISIPNPPDKLNYYAGEEFDPTGMEVTAKYSDDSTKVVTGYTYAPHSLTVETSEVEITYAEDDAIAKTSIAIVVQEHIAEIPRQTGTLRYTGSTLTPTWANYDSNLMTISGTTSAINIGTYTAKFTLKEHVKWSDGTYSPKSINWTISKRAGYLTCSTRTANLDMGDTRSITIVCTSSSSTISASSNNSNARVTVSGYNVTIESAAVGSSIVTIRGSETSEYAAPTSVTVNVTVKQTLWVKKATFSSVGTSTYTPSRVGVQLGAVIIGGGLPGYGSGAGQSYGGNGGNSGRYTRVSGVISGSGSYPIVVGAAASSLTATEGGTSSAFGATSSSGSFYSGGNGGYGSDGKAGSYGGIAYSFGDNIVISGGGGGGGTGGLAGRPPGNGGSGNYRGGNGGSGANSGGTPGNGGDASYYGCGGGGGGAGGSTGSKSTGGKGKSGAVIVYEYNP